MADVRLNVCGRQYDVHCADGQEDQLKRLAEIVDSKARGVGGGTEIRQLLFAALMLADEAQEQRGKLAEAMPAIDTVRAQIDALKASEGEAKAQLAAAEAREQAAHLRIRQLENAPAPLAAPSPSMTRALEQIADRIEALAGRVAPQA
jgi:cell division protein ZapA